jgi:hypothetical protein
VSVPTQGLDILSHISVPFFDIKFNGLRWDVVVRFVDIIAIVDNHCLSFVVDNHCLSFLFIMGYILFIIEDHSVTMRWKTEIKWLLIYLILILNIKWNGLLCSFPSQVICTQIDSLQFNYSKHLLIEMVNVPRVSKDVCMITIYIHSFHY